MELKKISTRKIFEATTALTAWLTIAFQFLLSKQMRQLPLAEFTKQFFSYFTILTCLIIAFCFTWLWLKPKSRIGRFFGRPHVLTAIAAYIFIVGIVYNIALRSLWHPKEYQILVDELLHVIIPLLYLLYWLFFVEKNDLRWTNTFAWLLYPLVYVLFIFMRGGITGFYPYPFLNVGQLGYPKVILNSLGLGLVILVVSLLLVSAGKMMDRNRN
jgi:hypothetical protein